MSSTGLWRDLSMIRRVKTGAVVAGAERLHDSLDALPRRGAPDEGVHGDPLLELKRGAVASTVDVHGHGWLRRPTAFPGARVSGAQGWGTATDRR
jgi:hypothetical protein